MRTLVEEISALTDADKAVSFCIGSIDRHEAIVSRLRAEGVDTTKAERMVQTFTNSLRVIARHRDLAAARVAALKTA